MADGYRYLQQAPDRIYSSRHTPKSSLQASLLQNPLLSLFAADPSLEPSRSPEYKPVMQGQQGMFGPAHQQGHNARLNGAPGGQRMPMLYNYQQQATHQHQAHAQHHQALQAEHSAHQNSGGVLGHHGGFPSVLQNSGPFAPANLQNGHVGSAARSAGQSQQYNEHWNQQLQLHKDAQQAHGAMIDQHQPHYYAKLKAAENKQPTSATAAEEQAEKNRVRPWRVDKWAGKQVWHNMDLSGQGLRNLSMPLFRYTFLNELYIASNKLSYLPAAIGQLRQLTHLDVSFNQLTELPPELCMCTMLKTLLLFDNAVRTLPFELGSLHLLEMLGIEGNPLDPELKQEIVERGTKSLITLLRETAPPPPEPMPRKAVVVQQDVSPSLERVRVFSWNTLCDKYSTEAIYGYTPSSALSWEYRKIKILEEIVASDADIVCLQEIATDAFKDFYSPELAMRDYRGVFFPKSRAKTMHEKDALGVDGCAVYFRQSKYILLDKVFFEYNQIAINRPDMKNHHDIFNRVMPKDQVAVLCFFESRATGARLLVSNTHLCWEPTLADVKVVQTAILMDQISKMAEKYTRWPPCKDKKMITPPQHPDDVEEGAHLPPPAVEPAPSQEYRTMSEIPLLVCGDFNSMADSAVYKLLSTGRVGGDHPDMKDYSYGNFTRDGIDHPFNLKSSYAILNGTPDELLFTNYTPDFANVIDYIWYSTNTLEVVELLGPPDAEHLLRVPGFPNYHFPADHIQIVADFVIKPRKGDKKAGGGASSAHEYGEYGGGSGGPSARN